MVKHTLQLLGGIELAGPSRAAANLLMSQSKAVALLAYCSMAPAGRFQRRDRLAVLLWPELDQSHARAALRKAIHAARSAMGEALFTTRGDEELLVDPGVLSCDVSAFTAHAEAGRLARALESYRGELMPGFHLNGCIEFGSWLDGERAAASQRASAAAWALAVELEGKRELTKAGQMAINAVSYDWSDERVLRRAMQMLVRIGNRAGAVRLFEDTARRMRAELETEPSPETVTLAASVRQG